MKITPALIRATLARYSREELEEQRDAALAELEAGGVITEAASGAGTSYKKQLVMTPVEAVELYQAALDALDGVDTSADVTQTARVVFGGVAVC